MRIDELDLPKRLSKKLTEGGLVEVGQLRVMAPANLRHIFALTDLDCDALEAALAGAGETGLGFPEREVRAPLVPKGPTPCMEEGCTEPRHSPYHRCAWHWLATQPIADQIKAAGWRLSQLGGAPFRARVKAEDWPPGTRWCSGCQTFVPDWYARGSRCRACASRAAYASHIQRTYNLDPQEYEQLLAFQGGRCYVCGQLPRVRRLAVDHDHVSGEVRGLLCANDEWGCNVSLRRLLGNPAAAARLLEYATKVPLQRMRDGDSPPAF